MIALLGALKEEVSDLRRQMGLEEVLAERACHLYSGEFYARLFRVLREGGKVFHYTGEPGSRYRRVDLRRGVMRRLRQAGFTDAAYVREVFGVVCEKPG